MSKYFKNAFLWNEDNKNFIGLPRPYVKINKKTQKNTPPHFKNKHNFYLHQEVPVPWQSIPRFDIGEHFNILKENENKVYLENRCAYCGSIFNSDEICVRWTTVDKIPEENGPRVLSDSHPFHIECMNQARRFCPHMRQTQDSEFQIGTYSFLRQGTDFYINELRSNKNTPPN